MEKKKVEGELFTIKSQLVQKNATWKHEFERHQYHVLKLEEKLMELKVNMKSKEDDSKELELLRCRVKTTAAILTYLKSKATVMGNAHLAGLSCGIKHQDGIGLVDKHGVPLSGWSNHVNLSSLRSSDGKPQPANKLELGSLEANSGKYIDEILKSTHLITDVMELLVKRAIKAETEAATEKEKVKLSLEENKQKTIRIQSMNIKVEEMEKFALNTNTLLNEMKQKVEVMVEESSRQRQQAAENELELHRVKQDFDSLRSFISSIISVTESVLSSERQFQTIDMLLDRLIAETANLENSKAQKEAEVQKLIEENVRLRALLDKKETQLVAMNEQYKWMVVNSPGI